MSELRSGFVTIVGRPNVGKSTLTNQLVGAKVSIVSARPQTTRNEIRGVVTRPGAQIVLLDTPGIHKPRTLLGERSNQRAVGTLAEVDAVCLVLAADEAVGPGDRFVAARVAETGTPAVVVCNKADRADRAQLAQRLAQAADLLDAVAYVPVSARTGDGCPALVDELVELLPAGPLYYPEGTLTDQPEAFIAAELVREKLLAVARQELPHSIAVVVDEVEEREARSGEPVLAMRARVLVERPSQKGMVVGRGGAVIKEAGSAARRELEALLGVKVHLETQVRVERDWQRRSHALDRLGL